MGKDILGGYTPTRRQFVMGSLGLAAAGALAACGGSSGGGGGGGGGGGNGGGGGGGGGTAYYANKGMDYFFFVVQNEAVRRASEELGYTYQTSNAEHDANAQFNNANSAILQRPALFISDPIDSEGLGPLTERAKAQQIPVGVIDTPLTVGQVDFTIAFDNRRGGEMAAERIVELLTAKYGSARGTVLNGYGALSSFAWRLRKEGFEEVLARYPDIQVLSRPTEGSEATARSLAAATLAEFPDLDAAHAPSDSITRGIITSLQAEGRALPAGQDGHVILTSIDGEPQSLQWLRDGLLDAEVSQDPVAYGQICVEMLHKHTVNGEAVPLGDYTNDKYFWETAPIEDSPTGPNCVIPPFYIDQSNLDDPRHWGNVVTSQWGMQQQ